MGSWVLFLWRTRLLMLRLLYYVPAAEKSPFCCTPSTHLYEHTMQDISDSPCTTPPHHTHTHTPCSAKKGKTKNSQHRRLTPGKTRMREWGEKLLQSKIAASLLFDRAIYRTQLEQNLPRCHENLILTLTFHDLLGQVFFFLKEKKKRLGEVLWGVDLFLCAIFLQKRSSKAVRLARDERYLWANTV